LSTNSHPTASAFLCLLRRLRGVILQGACWNWTPQ
jgi:hypothetical protein